MTSGHKELLVEPAGTIFDFAVSYESNRLVYLRNSDVYSQDISPTGQAHVRRLTDDGMTEHIALSQDGQKLTFKRREGKVDGTVTIWTIDLSAPSPTATRFEGLASISPGSRPFWLKNDKLIIPDIRLGNFSLTEVDVSLGTTTTRTVDIQNDGEHPPAQRYVSSDDGSLIAVSAGTHRSTQLVLIDTALGAIVARHPACEPLAWFAPNQLFCSTKDGYHLVGPDELTEAAKSSPSDDPEHHPQ